MSTQALKNAITKAKPLSERTIADLMSDAKIKAQEKELKAQIAEREDLLKIKIGSYSAMQAGGNTLFTWKAQSSSRFDSKAFQAAHPDLYRQYTKTSETRVLRLK